MTQKIKDFHARSISDRENFWADEAKLIDWDKPFEQVLDFSNPPFAKWFLNGKTNLCHNAIDRHLGDRANQDAIVYVSTETNEERKISYRELSEEVNKFSAVLKQHGVIKGDRVLIYMPMIPEAVFAMLACTRIGAVHSVVFGGFASSSLAQRIDDCSPKLMVTSDAGMRGGRVIPYKGLVDEAMSLAKCPPEHVLLVNRGLVEDISWTEGRDVDYAAARRAVGQVSVDVEGLESDEPSYILYSSGSTGEL